jgi:hypothetical protein
MADKAMDTYLNDHLAGATLGTDLAKQIREHSEAPSSDLMGRIATEIEEDRDTLIDLMERMGTSKNPVKQATAWMTEKASRTKFSGFTSGEPDLGAMMALETLTLGVAGKACLWRALRRVSDRYEALASTDFESLIERAKVQHDQLEEERIKAALRTLVGDRAAPSPDR